MDLDADGHMDILSGSYSRSGADMAGLFQVLRGTADGGFLPAEALAGMDDEPLIIPKGGGEDSIIDAICTRPTAADLNGDGHLDILSGNFGGSFYLFSGTEEGGFDPEGRWLKTADGAALQVAAHSDPFLIDWDGDGDLDLLSGSASGGVQLFKNLGSATEPSFAASTTLLKAPESEGLHSQSRFGEGHIKGPQGSTRVFAADVNGDGKLDLLVGDSVNLIFPADGLTEEQARTRLSAWDEQLNQGFEGEGDQFDFGAHYEARKEFLREESTGHVWLFLGR